MAQDPFNVDQLDIEPGSAGTRRINRAADGSLQFYDSLITGGITLKQLAGFGSIAKVLTVGTSGAGAEYTSPQAALDAIPVGASWTAPYLVLIGPGVWNETINLVRDGVILMGIGNPILGPLVTVADDPGAYHTMVIQAALGSIPTKVVLIGLTLTNLHQNYAGLRVVGSAGSTVASGGIWLRGCTLTATSALGNYTIWATTANQIEMDGGTQVGSTTLAQNLIQECSRFALRSVGQVAACTMRYDTAEDEPSITGDPRYLISGCPEVGVDSIIAPPVSLDMNSGQAHIVGCRTGALSAQGTRPLTITGSAIGALTLAESVAVTLVGSSRGALVAGGTATLDEPSVMGDAAFAAAATSAVVFTAPMSDASYVVTFELDAQPTNDEVPWITAKTAAGFTINFSTVQTLGCRWHATRAAE